MVSVVSVIHIVTFVDTRFSVCSRSSHHHQDWATTALLGEVKPCYQLRVVEAALMIRMEEEVPPLLSVSITQSLTIISGEMF